MKVIWMVISLILSLLVILKGLMVINAINQDPTISPWLKLLLPLAVFVLVGIVVGIVGLFVWAEDKIFGPRRT